MSLAHLPLAPKSTTNKYTNSQGFTLIELLIVLAIIGMLASLVGPRLINSLSKSQTKTTYSQIELLSTALDSFHLDNGRFPTQQEGLNALVIAPEGLMNWGGPYLKKRKLPKDAWGFEFHYDFPASKGGLEFDIYSFGADNLEGGEEANADINNWD